MSASYDTCAAVINVLEKYVPAHKMTQMIEELAMVDGNRSFRETVLLVRRIWRNRI